MAGEIKYDTLPFIDSSGRDCFEAGEDVSANLKNEKVELSDSVEHVKIDQSKAFNVFQNKYLDSSNTDFSDKILMSHKGGYEAKSIYEIIGEQVIKETPQQKYQRLQLELEELSSEVQQIKDSNESKTEFSPVNLAAQVRNLQSQLHNLHLEKVLGPAVTGTNGIQAGTWTRQITSQLKAVGGATTTGKKTDEKEIVYEMYYKPEHAKFAQAAKISELEEKLKAIESYIGKDTQKMQTVIADPDTNSSTLMDTTAAIHAKLQLFDISHIEIIAARLQGLLHCINEISQKKETIQDSERDTKINELHELVTSWESVATIVPELIERLKALQSLNEHANTFSQSLDHLTSTQNVIRDQLRSQKDSLDKYENSFAENVLSIQENCTALETRINTLMKKVGS